MRYKKNWSEIEKKILDYKLKKKLLEFHFIFLFSTKIFFINFDIHLFCCCGFEFNYIIFCKEKRERKKSWRKNLNS